MSPSGASRGWNLGPFGVFKVNRSTRKMRQSSRSMSHATRYQCLPKFTALCGSTVRCYTDWLLTNVSLYWFTGTGGSAAQIYYEDMTAAGGDWAEPVRGTV